MGTTGKVASACFVGGVVCSLTALILTPNYWWLGALAGMAGGYVGYEFREVLRAIPKAFSQAFADVDRWLRGPVAEKLGEMREWLAKPHPFVYMPLALALPMGLFLGARLAFCESMAQETRLTQFTGMPIFSLIIGGYLYGFVLFVMFMLVEMGSEFCERCYWQDVTSESAERFAEQGLRYEPLTYWNAYRWAGKGLGLVVLFFVWKMWWYIFFGIGAAIYGVALFLWCLFKLIHSKKRVLCAIDGTLGGLASYFLLVSSSTSLAGQVTLCLFGGLLGAGLGVISWELISKRALRLVPNGV